MASARPAHDTSPLEPEQLSDDELLTILGIERRLEEARSAVIDERPKGAALYLKSAETRYPRVLLLDGGRGTGKTSLLLTMVKRWHSSIFNSGAEAANLATSYAERIGKVDGDYKSAVETHRAPSGEIPFPDYVRVLAMLDFDPLPPGMPLLAAIVQAWRPLAEVYDRLLYSKNEDYEDEGPLMDSWHRLFQMAAAGWGNVSQNKNLLEQVLDREEQVENWQRLGDLWSSFVTDVIKQGRKLGGEDQLTERPIFAIMIDDCDLQVSRIRQLLPALRMLYHPSVFFLVAADRRHMAEMLQLDFYGQQSDLAHHQNAKAELLWDLIDADRWAVELADSSVNKVFPLKNRWKLRRLTLSELLDFPRDRTLKLKEILEHWEQQDTKERCWGSLGTYLERIAQRSVDLPPLVPYRAAHQIVEQASGQNQLRDRAAEAIRYLIGGYDSDDVVGSPQHVVQNQSKLTIEYLGTGELNALFHRGFREQFGEESGVVLSARPDFVYRVGSNRTRLSTAGSPHQVAKLTSTMIAASLNEDGYGVIATGLAWNIRLALAWTEERVFAEGLSLVLAFQWPFHVHPSPLQLLLWSRDWRDFIQALHQNPQDRLEHIAYAWIYYQLKWLRMDLGSLLPRNFKHVPEPFKEPFKEVTTWKRLLRLKPETGTERKYWTRRMQMLAVPELGLPVDVQRFLLTYVNNADRAWLRDQRRRLITDAIVAAAEQGDRRAVDAVDHKLVERVAEEFEKRHKNNDKNRAPSPWWTHVEEPLLDIQGTAQDQG